MPDIQEIFSRVQENQREVRDINRIKKDMLSSAAEYSDVVDELETLRARKKQIEEGIASQMSDKVERAERLKHEITDDRQLMADLALKNLISGQAVRVKGSSDEEYEPLFSVRFRKKGF